VPYWHCCSRPPVTLLIIVTLYLVLGLFLEALTLMITTIPIIAPVVFALGYDPVWFGTADHSKALAG